MEILHGTHNLGGALMSHDVSGEEEGRHSIGKPVLWESRIDRSIGPGKACLLQKQKDHDHNQGFKPDIIPQLHGPGCIGDDKA